MFRRTDTDTFSKVRSPPGPDSVTLARERLKVDATAGNVVLYATPAVDPTTGGRGHERLTGELPAPRRYPGVSTPARRKPW